MIVLFCQSDQSLYIMNFAIIHIKFSILYIVITSYIYSFSKDQINVIYTLFVKKF